MAERLSLPKLIELGFELCGTYDSSNGSLRECPPLTTVEKLVAFVESAGSLYGKKKARQALRHVADNSASPRETVVAMLLCLPYSMGGYGFEMPRMNYRIDLSKRARRIAGRNYLVCDLYWPDARLDVEYDGEAHVDVERASKDSMRRDALLSMDVKVVTITKWQLGDGGEMNALAHLLAKCIGKQLRYKDPQFTRANRELRRELLGRS